MPNAAQIEAWDGPAGEHWVAEAERYDRLNRGFGERIVAALAPSPGERVLDVGCGNGAVSLAVASLVAPDGSVTGLDISGPMLANARRRADGAGVANVVFEKGDAQVHPLPPAAFDAVTSRFGVMFFDDPVAAFTNLARALRPGGRVVFTCWQELLRNEWIMVPVAAALQHVPMPALGEPGAPGPFAFGDPDRVRSILGDAGLTDVRLDETVVPMVVGSSAEDALAFFRDSDFASALMKDVPEETAAAAWDAVRAAIGPYVRAGGEVEVTGTAWLVQATRR